jgi:hypothetical protein
MAGHRRGKLRGGGTAPRRRDARAADFMARLEYAPTAEAQLAIAFDYFRFAARQHPDRQAAFHRMATELVTQARRMGATA